jgi:ATP-dependent helicase HepA
MKSFFVGQRWLSETEPELGLGVIVEVQAKLVTIYFPAAKVDRRYSTFTAPLKRIKLDVGEKLQTQSGAEHLIIKVNLENEILQYETSEGTISETQLSDHLSFKKPEERLVAGVFDSIELFNLRYDVLLAKRERSLAESSGFLGGKVNLIPHQLYVAQEICHRMEPRVMLADEVGLGKTIEAGMILHHQILSGRVERALLLVPDSLVYQWFVEMLKKFHLSMTTLNQETEIEPGVNIFEESQFFIVSMKFLMRSPEILKQALSSSWDMVIIDEAHQLRWSPEAVSAEYEVAEKLAAQTRGLLLLSGTPEILGLAGHFSRLKLLDPQRFDSYDKFLQETLTYQKASEEAQAIEKDVSLSPETKHQKLQFLIDRHGTGRVYFRNTRRRMSSFLEFFPKRIVHPIELDKRNQK